MLVCVFAHENRLLTSSLALSARYATHFAGFPLPTFLRVLDFDILPVTEFGFGRALCAVPFPAFVAAAVHEPGFDLLRFPIFRILHVSV